ncbi:DUF2505 domain-containing protein [Brevibacterium ihuae]|uniref:DUF2505 domain-containing protein n=1 Tax=Brevibacterium ihuae TaxID=1631743 RepID=UPI0015E0A835|nr:DUF2505 domain-containing protein [Brevibacterium ihuae]
MKTIELRRRAARTPAQILRQVADPRTWAAEDTAVTVHRGAAEGIHLTTRTHIPASKLPPAASRFLGDGAELRQDVRADPVGPEAQAADVRIDAEVVGAPVDVDVAIALRVVGEGTDIHAITRIASSVPLFGSMIESALEPYVESLLTERLDQLIDL